MSKSLTQIITEQDFLRIAREHTQNFLKIYYLLHEKDKPHTRRFYGHLVEQSEELESFLDDHCARDNRTWYFFGELVACIRNIAKVGFILHHILKRFSAYGLGHDESDRFRKASQRVTSFLDKTVLSLFEEVKEEALRLGIRFPECILDNGSLRKIYPQKRLPYTIDEEDVLNAGEIAAKITTHYLHVIEKFDYFGWNLVEGHQDHPQDIIPNKINEERSRELVALIHNLQSTYDHYIKRTALESQDETLKRFRGYISMPLHLLDMVNWLSHLYQRHVHTKRQDPVRPHISAVIDEKTLMDVTINFALFYAGKYLRAGKNLACDILARYTEIDTCELKVPENLGFHLRPASLVAKLARYYGSELVLIVDGEEFDASSVLSITMAAGLIARRDHKTVVFRGDRRVLQDLRLLSECNYGQDDKGSATTLPPKLRYLWA
jgi:phosphotransferase system HPr (HPr) family protein